MSFAPQKTSNEFVFLKARYLVELTGRKARNLEELASYISTADPSTIFYHVFHPLLDAHLVPYEYPNDFSFWLSDSLQDKDLAEQVASIDLPESGGLEEVRRLLVRRIRLALETSAQLSQYSVHPGNEFNFVKCRYVVLPAGQEARTLDELADDVSQASELSIFYHMVTSRLFNASKYDDFSRWILENTEEAELAEQIRKIDPSTHMNVRTLQQELLDVISHYLRRKAMKHIK
ncbi:MAG: DUF5752 family protein [Nitrososphaerales archaeon]